MSQAVLIAVGIDWDGRREILAVEMAIRTPLTFFRLLRQHHKHLKSTNMLELLNEEIRRRTHVVRIFQTLSCLRLVRALVVETNENWIEANRYGRPARAQEARSTPSRMTSIMAAPICRT